MDESLKRLNDRERIKKWFWNASRYYDYPDGQDLPGKLKYTNKFAGIAGSLLGITWINSVRPIPITLREKFLRYFQCVLPCLGAASTFTCVTYFSTNIRKKDDPINYVLGGLAAGAILFPFTGNISMGVSAAIIFATTAFFQKALKMKNLSLLQNPVLRCRSPYYERNLDTSLEPDTRRGNWTK